MKFITKMNPKAVPVRRGRSAGRPGWPVSAEGNTNTTIQEGRINTNDTHQRGRVNDNATYQEGQDNANRTGSMAREHEPDRAVRQSNYNEPHQHQPGNRPRQSVSSGFGWLSPTPTPPPGRRPRMASKRHKPMKTLPGSVGVASWPPCPWRMPSRGPLRPTDPVRSLSRTSG